MDEDNCMVDVAKFYMEFICDESCGKCTPCRIGTKRMLEILTKITDGKATMDDLADLVKRRLTPFYPRLNISARNISRIS